MTVKAIGAMNNRWVGLSTDTKPTGLEVGSKFWEYDTGVTYVTYDGTNWKKIVTVGIDFGHWEIHDGDSFTAFYAVTTAATNAHRSGLYIKTGAKEVHVLTTFGASFAATASIQEAPTIAADTGSHSNVIYNRKRDSTKASTCLDNANPAVAAKFTTLTEAQIAGDGTWALGTTLRSEPLIAGQVEKTVGGTSRDAQEYILKVNTKYVFLLTNVGANANAHRIYVDWYEATV
jgi:hypothetical protein